MEIWKPVPDREGYLVSDLGRAAKIMERKPGPNGYIQMGVPRSDGKRHRDYLHHWVLWAFHSTKPEGGIARHLNDDRLDNRAENLKWGSRSENGLDAWSNGRRKR